MNHASRPSSPNWLASITSTANQISVSQPLRSRRMSSQASTPVASIAATPASAVVVALTPSAPPPIHKLNNRTNTASRIRSCRDIAPSSPSRCRANSGAAGVCVICGGYNR